MSRFAKTSPRAARLLLVGCSSLALAAPAAANELIFSSNGSELQIGQRTTQTSGVTQIELTGGAVVSIVDAAEYTINANGTIDLHSGSITVTGGDVETVVRMPEGLEGRLSDANSSASFTVAENGEASGHTLTGIVRVSTNRGGQQIFTDGHMWEASPGRRPRRTFANAAAPTPSPESDPVVAISDDSGPVGAAMNGIPVSLGDGLAGAGASADIIAAGRRVEAAVGNPSIETFPSGDLAILVAAAAELEGAYGGTPFDGAQADIIRTYLSFLASGASGADFLTAYSGFVIGYLDLIRAGGVPSGFANGVASAADIDTYLAFISRTQAIGGLAASDRVLAEAYLAFLASGGNRDLFVASFTDLTGAYFAFLRAGGVPADFTGASQAALAESIAFLQQSGLVAQLSAADQALVAAFLENGGIAFASQFETALNDYFTYLASGQAPSDYTVLDQATLRAYLETLSDTGLLEAVLADQAAFYADYLAFLRAGGDVDAFAGLPANIFAGYAVQLDAYFAFLASGNLPSQFSASDAAQLQALVLELQAAGALERFLSADQASFFASFSQFVAGGGAFDDFAGLNANIFAGYAVDLQAYFAFLEAGGVPSAYTVLTQETIEDYLAALEAAGATGVFLTDLADFYEAYFQFVIDGGNPDNFAGLPVPPDFPAFAAALNAYAAFLAGNGLPSGYTDEDLANLQNFFTAVLQAGRAGELLGDNEDLLTDYFAFLAGGGQVDEFTGLPIYADYVAALNAYADFLNSGGLPSDYAALDLAILQAYLDALAALPDGLAGFANLADNQTLLSAYFAFVSGGGDVDGFATLPIYLDYVAALNAYFAFLAGGGLPSEYADLDLAILEAYLEALAALQDGLAGFGDLNAFFVDYFAFIQAGNDPDQFAGLPANGGGGMGGGGTGFASFTPATEGQRVYVIGGQRAGRSALNNAVVSNEGALSGDFFTPGTATISDADGDGRGIVGAYRDGTFSFDNGQTFRDIGPNEALHYVALLPIIGDLPTTGTINYDVISATAPTYSDGSTTPGTFEASLTVGFGTSLRYGIDGTITMPDATYTFASPGRENGELANPQVANPDFFVLRPTLTGPGRACEAGQDCQLNLFGTFGGENPEERVGFAYESINRSIFDAPRLTGAVLFGAEGTLDVGSSGDTGGGSGGTITHPATLTYDGGFDDSGDVLAMVRVGGFEAIGLHTPEINEAGELSGTTDDWFVASDGGQYFDVQGDEGGIIGRYGGAQINLDRRTFFGVPTDAGAHYVLLAPFTGALPTGLMIEYDLLAATRPTFSDGAFGPGSFEGTLTVDYQSSFINSLFSGSVEMMEEDGLQLYEFNVQVVERNLMDWVAEGSQGFSTNVTGTGRACPAGSECQIKVILGGGGENGTERVGVAYEVVDVNVGISIEGAALFGQPGSATVGASQQSFANTLPSAPAISEVDWSRWDPRSGGQGNSMDLVDPIVTLGQPVARANPDEAPVRINRSQAMERAQQMMGIDISWGDQPHAR